MNLTRAPLACRETSRWNLWWTHWDAASPSGRHHTPKSFHEVVFHLLRFLEWSPKIWGEASSHCDLGVVRQISPLPSKFLEFSPHSGWCKLLSSMHQSWPWCLRFQVPSSADLVKDNLNRECWWVCNMVAQSPTSETIKKYGISNVTAHCRLWASRPAKMTRHLFLNSQLRMNIAKL